MASLMQDQKQCSTCNQTKALTDFHKNKNYRGGYTAQCKVCRLIAIKAWRKANPEKVRATRRRYFTSEKGRAFEKKQRLIHREKRHANLKRWRAAHPERQKFYDMKKSLARRGMTFEEYEVFAARYGNKCCICGSEGRGKIRLAIDHSHVTGENRGLLCINCNSMLGMVNDSTDLLRKAIEYLESRS